MRVGVQRHAPAALPPPPGRPGTCFIGGWVGSRTGLDECGKPETCHEDLEGSRSIAVLFLGTG